MRQYVVSVESFSWGKSKQLYRKLRNRAPFSLCSHQAETTVGKKLYRCLHKITETFHYEDRGWWESPGTELRHDHSLLLQSKKGITPKLSRALWVYSIKCVLVHTFKVWVSGGAVWLVLNHTNKHPEGPAMTTCLEPLQLLAFLINHSVLYRVEEGRFWRERNRSEQASIPPDC